MTARGSAGPGRGGGPARPRKGLVAVVDELDGDGLDEHPQEPFDLPACWGLPPEDGDPVGVPTPCARLRAGYWCACGGSFRSVRGGIPMTRARVALVPVGGDEEAVPFLDGPPSSAEVPAPGPQDRAVLRDALAALPLGTVVERKGIGFAPLFRPTVGSPVGVDAEGGLPW